MTERGSDIVNTLGRDRKTVTQKINDVHFESFVQPLKKKHDPADNSFRFDRPTKQNILFQN